MNDSISQVNFRMPTKLKSLLEAEARLKKRTLTAEIVARLEASLSGDRAAEVETSFQTPPMTLRDYFAAKAMQGLVTAAWSHPASATQAFKAMKKQMPPGERLDFRAWLAWYAYEQAEAMLTERGRPVDVQQEDPGKGGAA